MARGGTLPPLLRLFADCRSCARPFVIYKPQVKVFIVMYSGPPEGCNASSRVSHTQSIRPCAAPLSSGKPPQRFGLVPPVVVEE